MGRGRSVGGRGRCTDRVMVCRSHGAQVVGADRVMECRGHSAQDVRTGGLNVGSAHRNGDVGI